MKCIQYLFISFWACMSLASCIEHTEHLSVALFAVPPYQEGLYFMVRGEVLNTEVAEGEITAGICYVVNERRDPTLSDQVIEATEFDSRNRFQICLSEYCTGDYIVYRPFVKTKEELKYGESQFWGFNSCWDYRNSPIRLANKNILPHDVEIEAKVDLGPLNPSDYDFYICHGSGNRLVFNEDPTVQVFLDENNEIHTHLTDCVYQKHYTAQIFARRLKDDYLIDGSSCQFTIPNIRVSVKTLEIEGQATAPDMQLSGKALIEYGDFHDLSFSIQCFPVSGGYYCEMLEIPAVFCEEDSTFTATFHNLFYNCKYEYQAKVFGSDCHLCSFGHQYSFVTPIPDFINDVADLGLSVKWNGMNIGASQPEEFGQYFQWADTQSKTEEEISQYSRKWESYKYCNGSAEYITKYCCPHPGEKQRGTPDGKSQLEPEDDAATAILGPEWHTPSPNEWMELIRECTWSPMRLNGVNGYAVIADNGNAIFLPFKEYVAIGSYWTDSISDHNTYSATTIDLDALKRRSKIKTVRGSDVRYKLLPIRPVCR